MDFAMLRDFGNRVAEAYGLVFTLPDDLRAIYLKFGIDLARGNGDGTWRLPMPARFVIDGTGVIRAADVDPDYTKRTEPAETVAVLRQLNRRRRPRRPHHGAATETSRTLDRARPRAAIREPARPSPRGGHRPPQPEPSA